MTDGYGTTDALRELGALALGSRLRRLSDELMGAVAMVYVDAAIPFEPRWFPLYRLLFVQEPLPVGEAALALRISHAAVSQTATAMRKGGVLDFGKDPVDQRKRLLRLSAKGRAMEPELRPVWSDIRLALERVTSGAGVAALLAVDALEAALAEQGLSKRVAVERKRRLSAEVTIVGYRPELAKAFRELNVAWLEAYFEVEPDDRRMLKRPGRLVEQGGAIFFAKVGTDVVGTCAVLPRGEEQWELCKMAVAEQSRGRQVGRRLLDHVTRFAKGKGARRLFLETNSKLYPAVALYRSAGFRPYNPPEPSRFERVNLAMAMDLPNPWLGDFQRPGG